MFEDHHMKIPLPKRVYADFECSNQPQKYPHNPNVLFKQIPNTVGFHLISLFGNKYYPHFGEGCVKWFVNEMLTLKKLHRNILNQFYHYINSSRRSKNPTIQRVLVM